MAGSNGHQDDNPRRLPEKNIPDRAGYSFVFKERQQTYSRTMQLLSRRRRREKDKLDGIFFDRNRLIPDYYDVIFRGFSHARAEMRKRYMWLLHWSCYR